MKKYIAVAVVLSFFIVLLNGCSATSNESDDANNTITLEQFNQIENGMTYEEVTEILALSGELESKSEDEESESYLAIYSYNGEADDSKAIVMIQGDKVISKSQIGLE